MAVLKIVHLLSTIILSLAIIGRQAMASPPAIKAAYYPSWVETSFPPSAIDTTLFTHIFYAFAMPNNVTYKFEISNSDALLFQNFTSTLHHKNPPVKTLLSIGGGGTDSKLFARIASEGQPRQAFIASAIKVARKFGFDGLDLDWEFPESPKEMKDLGQLFEDWRHAIQKEAISTHRSPLLLTSAVYFSPEFLWDDNYRTYPVESMKRNLDWANAMCYDYSGSWDTSATGAHAALYNPKSNISTSYGLKSWVGAGMPQTRLVMGLPLYGKTWQLKDPNLHGIGAPAVAVGPGDEGVLLYKEVVEFNKEHGATIVYDSETVSTYSYAGSIWIGYDDVQSTTTKVGFARALGLRGYFFWALSFDTDWKISKQASRAWAI